MIAADLRSLYLRPSPSHPKLSTSDLSEIRRTLEEGPDVARIATLKSLIVSLVNGEHEMVEGLVMTLIRFVLPLKDKTVKKLLLLLFENMNKTDNEGNLKQEFILVCNAWRNDLQHPNEYVRGATLRFLCHLREPELLEPLMPSVRNCLEHDHVYVRKHAVYALMSIYKHVDYLIPDAPELIESLLSHEPEIACQKAAFLFLSSTEPIRAINFFNLIADRLAEMDGSLQLAVVDFIRNGFVAINDEEMKNKFCKVLINLLKKSSSPAAKYESASTLIVFSPQSETVKMAVDSLISLASKEADNSVKLMILTKLQTEILPHHLEILQSSVLDLLRIISSPDSTVRRICLELVAASATSRVALEIVQFLKKEASKAASPDQNEYRQNVLDALYKCSMNFSEVGTEVMNAYLELIKNGFISESLVSFMKEALFKYPKLRQTYLYSVISALPSVADSKSLRSLLWLVGEFCVDNGNILAAIQAINSGLGELPMLAVEEKYEAALKANGESENSSPSNENGSTQKVSTKILADGTYASEIKDETKLGSNSTGRQLPNIKRLFLDGKFECSGVLSDSLCKLMIRLKSSNIDSSQFLALRTRVLLMLTSVLRLGGSKYVAQPIDRDSAERIALCIQILLSNEDSLVVRDLEMALTIESESAFNLIQQKGRKREETATGNHFQQGQVDDVIEFKLFSHLKSTSRKRSLSPEDTLNLVLNENCTSSSTSTNNSHKASLNRVVQLTGFSDAIYAETYVEMAGKEVLLDLLLVNQTEETLQNVSIDLVCAGDLKLIEKPVQLTLPPFSFSACKAIFRVTATNHGQIFGCISYLTGPSGQDAETVILSEIKIDVLEYVKPAQIDETLFRDVWILLEWENKISIKVPKNVSSCPDLKAFLEYLMKQGNLVCITPNVFITDENEVDKSSSFLACNLYAKSIFDEEILANLCLELNGKTKSITGHLRLRSKTQGLAVAYGDKLNQLIQKLK